MTCGICKPSTAVKFWSLKSRYTFYFYSFKENPGDSAIYMGDESHVCREMGKCEQEWRQHLDL